MDFALVLQLLVYAAPVAIAAMGEGVGQKGGVLNIGLEGTMLASAFGAAMVTIATKNPTLGLIGGAAVGLVVTMISASFAILLGSDQVVVGTAVNLLSLGVTGTLFRSKFGQSGQLLSLPPLPKWHGVDIVVPSMIVLAVLLWLLLNRTAWGLALRAAGEYPKSVEASGFSVFLLRFSGCAVSGLLGGLAGAYLCVGVANSFAENMTVGRGFVAIAMVTFGRWRPISILIASLVIGALDILQFRFQAMGIKVPFQFLVALPYIIALAVLVVVGKGVAAPNALGRPYERAK